MKKISKTCAMAILLAFSLAAESCAASQGREAGGISQQLMADAFGLSGLIAYSTNFVKAELLSKGQFDKTVPVLKYRVLENIAGSAEDEIFVYGEPAVPCKEGDVRYMVLGGTELALYPHTVYTELDFSMKKGKATYFGKDLGYSFEQIVGEIKTAEKMGALGSKKDPSVPVSDSESIAEVSSQSDVIVKIALSSPSPVLSNEYCTLYSVKSAETLKGPNYPMDSVSLPPGLKGGDYYVFLKKAPRGYWMEQDYFYIFSRKFPAVRADSEAAKLIRFE